MGIKAILSANTKIVTGASNVRIAFAQAADTLTAENIAITSIEGDLPNPDYRVFGAGVNWYVQYTLPEDASGTFQVGLTGDIAFDGTVEAVNTRPVTVEFDTRRTLTATFGTPRMANGQLLLPVVLDADVVGLTKKHFQLTAVSGHSVSRLKCYLYGSDREYELAVIPNTYKGTFSVDFARAVRKANGLIVDVAVEALEVSYPNS